MRGEEPVLGLLVLLVQSGQPLLQLRNLLLHKRRPCLVGKACAYLGNLLSFRRSQRSDLPVVELDLLVDGLDRRPFDGLTRKRPRLRQTLTGGNDVRVVIGVGRASRGERRCCSIACAPR